MTIALTRQIAFTIKHMHFTQLGLSGNMQDTVTLDFKVSLLQSNYTFKH